MIRKSPRREVPGSAGSVTTTNFGEIMSGGKKTWYFPDGYLPEKNPESAMEAHEALMLFNTRRDAVKAEITVYFSGREPMRNIEVTVPAERINSRKGRLEPSQMGGS